MTELKCLGLIPARSGSKRIENKNIRLLDGHPLIAYSIRSALDSGVFESVVVSTDSEEFAQISREYGAEVPFLRPSEFAGDGSPDIEWIDYTLNKLAEDGREYDCFAILRPTSPFRKAETIARAWDKFNSLNNVDSLRAVELCAQHPAKMWSIQGDTMTPILPYTNAGTPWHSSQYPTLPQIYIQNASLEIAHTRVVTEMGSIAGNVIAPFLTEGDEGLDLNTELDWDVIEAMIARGDAVLSQIKNS
jgi:CMP-N,N'-diacetyllegionaminic acid synthase